MDWDEGEGNWEVDHLNYNMVLGVVFMIIAVCIGLCGLCCTLRQYGTRAECLDAICIVYCSCWYEPSRGYGRGQTLDEFYGDLEDAGKCQEVKRHKILERDWPPPPGRAELAAVEEANKAAALLKTERRRQRGMSFSARTASAATAAMMAEVDAIDEAAAPPKLSEELRPSGTKASECPRPPGAVKRP